MSYLNIYISDDTCCSTYFILACTYISVLTARPVRGLLRGSGLGFGSAAPMRAVGGVTATGSPGVGDSVVCIERGISDSVVSAPRERHGLPEPVMWALATQPSQLISLHVCLV